MSPVTSMTGEAAIRPREQMALILLTSLLCFGCCYSLS